MSASGFFGRKARALAAAFAIAVGAGGGAYVAHERSQAVESQFTLASANHIRGMDENVLLNGHMPLFASMDAASEKARAKALKDSTAAIDAMERMKAGMDSETAGALQAAAVDFVNTLRTSENLTERDYAKLLKDYDARVGVDVTAQAGNYRTGIKFMQECKVFSAFGDFLDDEDETPLAERAKEIGTCATNPEIDEYLAELDEKDGMKSELAGAAGGAGLAGFALLPFLRRRRNTPPVQKGFRP